MELDDFKNELANINQQNNLMVVDLVTNLIEKEIDRKFEEKYNQQIKEIVDDKLIKNNKKTEIEHQKIHDRINQAGKYMISLEEITNSRFNKMEEKTDTLEFCGRSDELRRYIHNRVYKTTGIKEDSIEEGLFFGKLNRELQSVIKKKFGINRYGLLLLSDLDECKELINKWYPQSNYRSKYMEEYRKRDDKKGLPCTLKKLYDNYLDLHEGAI